MTSKKIFVSFGLSVSFLFGVLSCSKGTADTLKQADLKDAKEYVQQNYVDFVEGSPVRLIGCADGYSNDGAFGTTWSKDNMLFDNENGMSLFLEVSDNPSKIKTASGDPYVSAEMRSVSDFQYGFFGTYMKPSSVNGTASTFFLYSDNPHDEIDIEFLGKDTTKVQFNYFKNDVGGNEYWYDLGFDASEEYHHYGFYWGQKEICWYVDFKPVYRLVGDNCPSSKCKLMCNHWAGNTTDSGIIAWMGKVNESDCPSFSTYKNIEIADLEGKELRVKPKIKEYDICPSDNKLEVKPVTFKSVTAYTVADKTSTTEFDISYKKEDITSNYRCVKLTVEGVAGMKWVQYKVKNLYSDTNNPHPTLCRLTVDSYANGVTGQNKIFNIWKNGVTSGSTVLKNSNLEAHYEIQMNEEAVMTFRWYGEGANELTLMFDDFGDCQVKDGMGQRDGHVLISDFKFGGEQDYVAIDNSGYVDEYYTKNGEIEDPETDQVAIPSDYTKVSGVNFGATNYYQVQDTEEGIKITYNQVGGYEQTGWYGSDNMFNGAREIIFVMKNDYRKEVEFQLKIRNAAKDPVVSKAEVISDKSTGRFHRFSSSTPNVPYLIISGGRTCQYKLTLTDNVKSFILVMSVGAPLSSSCLIKGIYARNAQ